MAWAPSFHDSNPAESPEGERCETKPIARSGAPRRCLDCGLRIGNRSAAGRRPSGLRRAKGAKRTQSGMRGQIVQNEANSRQRPLGRGPRGVGRGSRLCKTNPISPTGTGRGRGTNVQNEANLASGGELCKTNPICTAGPRRIIGRIPMPRVRPGHLRLPWKGRELTVDRVGAAY